MPSQTILHHYGLYNTPNPFADVPDGALALADEVTCRASGVLGPRRGMRPSVQFNADKCWPLPGTSKVLTTSRLNPQPTIYDPDLDTTLALLGSPVLPLVYPYASDARVSIQAASQNGNLYLTTARGIVAAAGLSTYAGNQQRTARPAGLPWLPAPQIGFFGSAFNPPVMSINCRRTYRVTLAMYDVFGNFYESAPSEPAWIENGGTPSGVRVIAFLPPGVGLNWPATASAPFAPPILLVRAWRAAETAIGVVASDEMFLIGTVILGGLAFTPLTFTAGGFIDPNGAGAQVWVDDASLDSTLTIPLYTNPKTGDGFGIISSNDTPPAAGAIATFKGRALYGRPSFRHTLQIQVIGVGAGGIVAGDTITIDGYVYTAFASGIGGSTFTATTSLGPAENISRTAKSLVSAINTMNRAPNPNAYPGQPSPYSTRPEQYRVVAKYISSDVNDFGRISIERIFPVTNGDDPAAQFSAIPSSGGGFSFPNGTQNSTDNYSPGGLCWSKFGQPEAVPAVNFAQIGDVSKALLGFSVHRDAVIIYKEDGAWIYHDDGGPQPSILLLDASVVSIAPDTIAVVNNNAYVWTARGLLQVSEQGTLPVSEPVRSDLSKLLNLNIAMQSGGYAFGVGYEAERLYILGLPASSNESGCSYQYILRIPDPGYPPAPPRWSRWLVSGITAGCVLPGPNKLVLAYSTQPQGSNLLAAPTGGLMVERKSGVVSTDFFDFSGSVACPANTVTNKLVFPQDVHLEIRRGDVFWYNPAGPGTKLYMARVLTVVGATVTLDTVIPFALGSLTYFRGIQSHWRYTPICMGEPTAEKMWRYVQFYFDYLDGDFVDVNLDSEKAQVQVASQVNTDSVIPNNAKLLNQTQWLRVCRDVVLRVDAGKNEARAARLGVEVVHGQALASFRLLAMSASAHEAKEVSTR